MDRVRDNNGSLSHSLAASLRKVLVAVIQACGKRLHPAVLQEMMLSVGVQLGRQAAAEYRLTHLVSERLGSDGCARCLEAIGKQFGWELRTSVESESVIRVDEHRCEVAQLGEFNPYLTQVGFGFLGGVAADEFDYAKVCVAEMPPFHRTIRIHVRETPESLAAHGVVYPRLSDQPVQRAQERMDTGPGVRLTPREAQVLQHVVQGLPDRKIATMLQLSVRTVENHAARIRKKLRINNRAALVRFALQNRLADL